MSNQIDPLDHRRLALWAADCAERVLPVFEMQHPHDDRPRRAIAAARAWTRGEVTVSGARAAAFAAHAAARDAADKAAQWAARAAGHAAATAHVAGHARHAANYAAQAAADPTLEAAWQAQHLPNASLTGSTNTFRLTAMTTPDTITLPKHIYDEIIAHAQAGAPQEVCGILSGRDGAASELVRARNEAANPIMDYWVDGPTLLKQFDFEERGEAMIAIYHSHPVDPPYPSATDAANAFYPDAVYLICSLLQPEQPTIRGWRLIQQELAARPAQIQAVRGNPRFWAQHRRGQHEDAYDLVVVEEDGRERWVQVRIIEQEIIVA